VDVEMLSLPTPLTFNGQQVSFVSNGQFSNPTVSPISTGSSYTSFITFTPSSQMILQPNTTYALSISGISGHADAFRCVADTSLVFGGDVTLQSAGPITNRPVAYFENNGSWQAGLGEVPVLELDVTAAPEPGSLTAAMVITGALICWRRKKSESVQFVILS